MNEKKLLQHSTAIAFGNESDLWIK